MTEVERPNGTVPLSGQEGNIHIPRVISSTIPTAPTPNPPPLSAPQANGSVVGPAPNDESPSSSGENNQVYITSTIPRAPPSHESAVFTPPAPPAQVNNNSNEDNSPTPKYKTTIPDSVPSAVNIGETNAAPNAVVPDNGVAQTATPTYTSSKPQASVDVDVSNVTLSDPEPPAVPPITPPVTVSEHSPQPPAETPLYGDIIGPIQVIDDGIPEYPESRDNVEDDVPPPPVPVVTQPAPSAFKSNNKPKPKKLQVSFNEQVIVTSEEDGSDLVQDLQHVDHEYNPVGERDTSSTDQHADMNGGHRISSIDPLTLEAYGAVESDAPKGMLDEPMFSYQEGGRKGLRFCIILLIISLVATIIAVVALAVLYILTTRSNWTSEVVDLRTKMNMLRADESHPFPNSWYLNTDTGVIYLLTEEEKMTNQNLTFTSLTWLRGQAVKVEGTNGVVQIVGDPLENTSAKYTIVLENVKTYSIEVQGQKEYSLILLSPSSGSNKR